VSRLSLLQAERTALVIAHPGHELLVHGWLERARPHVCVLTDGSGGRGCPRLQSTGRVLEASGARPGPVYGDLTDRAVYSILLDGDFRPLTALYHTLVRTFLDSRIECVVGDAAEGHNPAHDLCRLLVNAAVAGAARLGWKVDNYEFAQVGRPDGSDRPRANGGASAREREHIVLDDAELERKLAAAAGYPEMAAEVERAVAAYGVAWCRTEWFLRAADDPTGAHRAQPPYYETFGAQRVVEGLYARVLRYHEHVVPAIDHLRGLVDAQCAIDADSLSLNRR
jgi:hypothetical protein